MAPQGSNVSRKRIQRAFQMNGLTLRVDALDGVMNVIGREDNPIEAMQNLIQSIKAHMAQNGDRGNNDATSGILTQQLLQVVVSELSHDAQDIMNESIQLLNALDTPRLHYDAMRKDFTLFRNVDEGRSLYGKAEDKPNMFIQRLALVQQRLLKQDLFRPKLVSSTGRGDEETSATVSLTPVESLLGRPGVKTLLGMITQVEEGQYYLEDMTSMVPLNLSECQVLSDGFICENCIVLVEGEFIDGVFWASKMGHPPTEPRYDSIVESIGYSKSDIFGNIPSESEYFKTQEQELQHGTEGMFVILSDVHLDDPTVMEKLGTLFNGYMHNDPLPIFVLMGNFTSRPIIFSEGPSYYTSLFDDLANMIAQNHPRIAQEARLVFIPGYYDPPQQTGGNCLPRAPIANIFTKTLRRKISHAVFASNPCRIRFFTKELVFFRHSAIHVMEKFSILNPRCNSSNQVGTTSPERNAKDGKNNTVPESPQNVASFTQGLTEDSPSKPSYKTSEMDEYDSRVDHAVKTMLDQAHLCPVPLAAQPIFWQYDHTLRLFPLPDALIVADQPSTPAFCRSYKDCTVVHPGSFTTNKRNKESSFQFVAFYPIRVGRTKKEYDDALDEEEQGESSAVEFSQVD